MVNDQAELVKELSLHNIRPSHQRIVLLSYLRSHNAHPTVDEIYQALKPEIATLSKSTVYNTLEIFCRSKIARAITIEENEIRYDAITQSHGHFKCEQCGRIDNFTADLEQLELFELNKYQIQQRDVYFRGICAECLENMNNQMEDKT